MKGKNQMSTQKTFALVLGIVLLLVGILGFINNPIVGESAFFGANVTQHVLHIIAGILGIYFGSKGTGAGYNMTIGWIGIILGILGFIPGIAGLLNDFLAINTAISILHVVIGIVALGVYYSSK